MDLLEWIIRRRLKRKNKPPASMWIKILCSLSRLKHHLSMLTAPRLLLLCLDGAPPAVLLPGPPAPGWGSLFGPFSMPATNVGRQAGTWDPQRQGCSACPWTQLSSSNNNNKNPKTCMGLKITMCMHSWGKFWTKRYKETKKPNCHFWRVWNKNRGLGAKAGYWACPPHSALQKGGQIT